MTSQPLQLLFCSLCVRLRFSAILAAACIAIVLGTNCATAQQPDASLPPPPATLQNLIPPAQLAFMQNYVGQPTRNLLKDKQYKAIRKAAIPNTMFHYGRDMGLDDALAYVLDGSKTPVALRDGRYLMIAGSEGPILRGRGFLWFDMQNGVALGVFYFQPTNGEPTPTITVFSRQLSETDLSSSQLPPPFMEDFAQWAVVTKTAGISPRYFIPANGKKYPLLHDEDYCGHLPGTAAPDPKVCQELSAEAADADMNAAYFMREVHNAANGTAWMLGSDQVAWTGMRQTTCGVLLPCRIQLTQARVRLLVGRR